MEFVSGNAYFFHHAMPVKTRKRVSLQILRKLEVNSLMTTENSSYVDLEIIQVAMQSHSQRLEQDERSSVAGGKRTLSIQTLNEMMGRREVSHQKVKSYLVGGGDIMPAIRFVLFASMSL